MVLDNLRPDLIMNPGRNKSDSTKAASKSKPQRANTEIILGRLCGSVDGERAKVPRRWLKHYRKLLSLKVRLQKERDDGASDARLLLEPFSMHLGDVATDDFEHDLLLAQISTWQSALYEIDEALKRIVNATYGVCELSHKPISAARLKALPWTRFAEGEEEQLEKNKRLSRVKLGQFRSVQGQSASIPIISGEEEIEEPPADEGLHRTQIPNL